MDKFGKSQPITRFEDQRFLTGAGRYVDDITPDGALHAFMFRSPVAHASITTLDVSEALAAPGVAAVYTCADLEAAGVSIDMYFITMKNRDGSDGAAPVRPILAKDKLRFVGDAIALVVADTLDQARDAAELIELDYDELPAKMDLARGGEAIHADVPDNLVFDWGLGDAEATQAAFDAAAHVVLSLIHI